jgi:hemolysin activation/secretion protein
VRAYATGDGAVDQGFVGTLEVRQTLKQSLVPVLVTLTGFFDIGAGKLVAHPFAEGSNHLRLMGAGAGATFAAPHDFWLTVSYAHTVGYVPTAIGTGHANRFWLTMAKFF